MIDTNIFNEQSKKTIKGPVQFSNGDILFYLSGGSFVIIIPGEESLDRNYRLWYYDNDIRQRVMRGLTPEEMEFVDEAIAEMNSNNSVLKQNIELTEVCAQAFQILKEVADEHGYGGDQWMKKILENLQTGKLKHKDIVAFRSRSENQENMSPEPNQEEEALPKNRADLRSMIQQQISEYFDSLRRMLGLDPMVPLTPAPPMPSFVQLRELKSDPVLLQRLAAQMEPLQSEPVTSKNPFYNANNVYSFTPVSKT